MKWTCYLLLASFAGGCGSSGEPEDGGSDGGSGGCGLGPACEAPRVCVSGTCVLAARDADGDGTATAFDCDDTDPTVTSSLHRPCTSPCGDGVERCTGGIWEPCDAPADCTCEPDETHETACGTCGTATRGCGADGLWGPAGECIEGGECVPGATETSQEACDDGCGVGTRTVERACQADCTLGDPVPTSPCVSGGRSVRLLMDDFDDNTRGALWTTYEEPGAQVVEEGGELVVSIDAGATGYAGYFSVDGGTFANDCAFVEVPADGLLNAGTEAYFVIENVVGDDAVAFLLAGGVLNFIVRLDGVRTTLDSVFHDLEAHRWWRIRRRDDSVHLETSASGATWQTRATAPAPAFLDGEVYVNMGAGAYETTTSATTVHFDNCGTPPGP